MAARRQLLRFLVSGERPSGAKPIPAAQWPALLHRYRDLSRLRHDYPILQTDAGHGEALRPLSTVVDELIARVGDGGDEEERLRRHLYRLESAIKAAAEQEGGGRLSVLWESASERLLAAPKQTAKRKQRLQTNLMLARQALDEDGELLTCSENVPGRLLAAAVASDWRRRCEGWRDELQILIGGLKDILRADFDRSPAAASPQHLRESTGVGDDMDFEAMSAILRGVQRGERLPDERRERIIHILSTILEVFPLFGGGPEAEHPFSTAPVLDDIDAAVQQHKKRMDRMTAFFRAVEIAQLEVENRYRPASHDAYFARYDESFLSHEQRARCPPTTVRLRQKQLNEARAGAVLKALASGLPLKLLIEIEDLCPQDLGAQRIATDWAARLAVMTMALSDVYVLQCAISQPFRLRDGFEGGMRYEGAALYNVYVGSRHSRLPAYLDAAAAAESRVFPTFRFDPAAGDRQAERIDILDNLHAEMDWPATTFRYRAAEDRESETELVFMPADFWFCDARAASHFWHVPPALWHSDMLLLQNYLKLDAEATEAKMPYLTVVDASGETGRVAVTRWVVTAVLETAQRWRSLQESGGINNSFALQLLAAERQILDEEKARTVEALEKEYSGKLDENLGALTREIAARIARQLMSGASDAIPSLAALAPAAQAPAAATPLVVDQPPADEAPAAVEEEEEEETLSFDEPYIDTVLCTSCNECTDLYPHIFNYDDNKQAYIADAAAGTYRELVLAAEVCPVRIIHPGKPVNPDEPNLAEWLNRAAPFN